jgi:hypothetical protein
MYLLTFCCDLRHGYAIGRLLLAMKDGAADDLMNSWAASRSMKPCTCEVFSLRLRKADYATAKRSIATLYIYVWAGLPGSQNLSVPDFSFGSPPHCLRLIGEKMRCEEQR